MASTSAGEGPFFPLPGQSTALERRPQSVSEKIDFFLDGLCAVL
jgi:hypothetical protein